MAALAPAAPPYLLKSPSKAVSASFVSTLASPLETALGSHRAQRSQYQCYSLAHREAIQAPRNKELAKAKPDSCNLRVMALGWTMLPLGTPAQAQHIVWTSPPRTDQLQSPPISVCLILLVWTCWEDSVLFCIPQSIRRRKEVIKCLMN